MHESDPADLDGDGSFDAIDITILEGEDNGEKKHPARDKSGCCLVLFIFGLTAGAGWWMSWYMA